ncbi:MAG: helix-turn-helix domain-containing protein, partial [Clostridia bacterium]|nr:helix-turn-helix domain-containing protein [Clostridia bacterium]
MATLNDIREKLKKEIELSNLTQTELAKRIGVHRSAIGQYLSWRSMPALDTFAKLCAVLDLDANEI